MTHKIFRSIFGTAILVLLISAGLIFGVVYENSTQISEHQLRQQLDLTAQGLSDEGESYLEEIQTDSLRVTWISAKGKVLYDSVEKNPAVMGNHKNRKEVREAMRSANGYGSSIRYSKTMTKRMLYAAKRMGDGTVLRVSVTQDSVLTLLLGILQPVTVIIILLVILSVVIASRLSRKIVEPMNHLDLDHPLENEEYDELSPLLRRIQSQQTEIRTQKNTLEKKQKELDTILENMSEGMIILQKDGRIVSLNRAAAKILGIHHSHEGENLLRVSRNIDLVHLVEDSLKGQPREEILFLDGRDYQINATPFLEGDRILGSALTFIDVTDREMAESMRREFTANVSHELKTPLHSISGYAELMMNRMVPEKQVPDCAGRIYKETHRMIQLVEDIISLSHLDEGADDVGWEDADLYEIAESIVESQKPAAGDKRITIHLSGESSRMVGKKPLLQTIVNNLCDNAIKYTGEGGQIQVGVRPEGESIRLSVRDNGIGIPAADQNRIFERFYRVDKSHSKEIGGTGLGLSIVKHAVMVHHGRIEVQSEPGKGSLFIVILPINPPDSPDQTSSPATQC